MLKKYWLGILSLILLGIAFTIALLPVAVTTAASAAVKSLELTTTVLGWVLFLAQYLYNKSEILYIRVNSARLWLTNGVTKWNFNVDFYNTTSPSQLQRINKLISDLNPKSTTWHKDDNSSIVNVPGYTIRIIDTQLNNAMDERDTVLTLQISNLELPYRSFRSKIENEIVPLLNEIGNIVKPSNPKYVAKIGFSIPNPYFGFFVRKLDLPKVVSFTCDILEGGIAGKSQNVTVRKDKIEIVADNLLALQMLSFKYMALSVN